MSRRHLRATATAMINTRLVALTWIIAPIIQGLIDLTWTIQPIIAVPIARMRTTERIILVLSTRARTIEQITLGRGVRLLSDRCNPIQPHLRTQLPNMQPRNMRPMRVAARSHLTMSATRSHRTNTAV
jgi:hypothetical protein